MQPVNAACPRFAAFLSDVPMKFVTTELRQGMPKDTPEQEKPSRIGTGAIRGQILPMIQMTD